MHALSSIYLFIFLHNETCLEKEAEPQFLLSFKLDKLKKSAACLMLLTEPVGLHFITFAIQIKILMYLYTYVCIFSLFGCI